MMQKNNVSIRLAEKRDIPHIAELERALPEDSYSDYVKTVLTNLKQIGYDGTVSFESKNGSGLESMKKALALLKNTL